MKYFFLLISLYIVLTKIVVNTNSNVHGNFQASSAGYIVAVITLLFIFMVVIKRYKNLRYISNYFFIKVPLIYYSYAFVFSIFSLLPTLSMFRSVSGIGFVLVGSAIGKYLRKFTLPIKIKLYYKLLLIVFFIGIIGNIMYSVRYVSNFSILNLQAGYVALICIYIGVWHLIDYMENKKNKDFIIFIFLFLFTSMLHSFSAYIAFYISLIFLFFYKNKFLLSFILVSMPIVSLFFIIDYLNAHLDTVILGKPAAAYLIGSGRFDVYSAAIDAFSKLDLLHKIIGVGFMSERNILSGYDLTWSSDPHNSFIVSLLGLGIIGAIIYIIFILTPFLFRKKLQKTILKHLVLKWIIMHIMFLVYGVTSSSYLAVPTMQLILFIIFSYIIFDNKRESYAT